MKLVFSKPICFFDLETTGLNIAKDRIVSISIIKLFPDQSRNSYDKLINPTISIPKEASDVHGITDEMVKDAPKFSEVYKEIYNFMCDSDIAGFNNNNYDNALLFEEFNRCGILFPNTNTESIDVCNIFKKKERRDLASAVKFYCNKELENAHNAKNDIEATVEVFIAQLEKYPDLSNKTSEEISQFSKVDNRVDFDGKIVKDKEGDLVYNFGREKGKKIKENTGFAVWMLSQDFISQNTKMILKDFFRQN